MKQKLKQSKGITLISLVVTIIVLIILAGISLYLVLGENGLIEKAKETKPIVDITSAQEKLELVKGPVQLEKYSVNLDDYLEELDKVKEKYEVDDIERIDNDNAEIIIGGKYKFIATDEKNGNVKITYQGEVGGLEISPTSGTYKYPTTGTFEVIKNISGGELSVKSENESIAKASISGTIVTVEPQDMAGTTKIVVTSAAKGEYAQGKAIYTAIVENGTISLEADAYTGNYDGKDHDAVSNVKVTPADATLTYSLNGGEFSSTIPKVNGATTYTVVVKATKAGYATKTLTKTITIGKNTETGNLVLSANSGTITYPTAGTFTVTKNTSGGTLSVTSSDTSVATASISGTTVTITPKAISANGKKTTITVTSAATSNYEAQTKTYTATVNMGTITLSADAYTGKYDGKDHDAVSNVKVTPADATLTYSLNGGTFSSTIPKVNGATTYTVVVKASKSGYATKTLTKTITIGKNTETGNLVLSANSGTITYPTAGTFTVTKNTSGGALSVTSSDTSVATASISGTTVTITPKAISANGKKTTITVTSAATSNYEAQTKTYTATVNMGTITLSADAYTGNYDGKDHDAVSNVKVTPTDATLTYSLNGGTFSSTIPKVNGATTYTVVVKATKAGYTTKTLTKTIIVVDSTSPIVTLTEYSILTTSFKVIASAIDNESGMDSNPIYTFYLNGIEVQSSTSATYEPTGLSEYTTYTVKVTVTDKAGNIGEKSLDIRTHGYLENIVKTGDYVKYNTGAKSYTIGTGTSYYSTDQTFNTADATDLWQVLYNDSTYGVQLTSSKNVITITLGTNKVASKGWNAYQNLISILNTISDYYINTNYAVSARSIGTVPSNRAAESSNITFKLGSGISTSNIGKNTDTNYTKDLTAMQNAKNQNSSGIASTGETYFLGSRYLAISSQYTDDGGAVFNARIINSSGSISNASIAVATNSANYTYSGWSKQYTGGVRPVVKLKSNIIITDGDGTENNPYILQ